MISIIVAIAPNGVIGDGGSLLWHISEDLKRFKRITLGHPVVMGRKTFESLGRPLPGRENVIVTRQMNYRAEGCTVVNSIHEAFALFPPQQEIFIIGGGDIYRQALPMADRLYLTRIMHDYAGDVRFPAIDPSEWVEVFREYHEHGKDFEYPFEYIDCVRV